jgi:hypothetical protein
MRAPPSDGRETLTLMAVSLEQRRAARPEDQSKALVFALDRLGSSPIPLPKPRRIAPNPAVSAPPAESLNPRWTLAIRAFLPYWRLPSGARGRKFESCRARFSSRAQGSRSSWALRERVASQTMRRLRVWPNSPP